MALYAAAIQYNTYSTNYASLAVDGSLATLSCTGIASGQQLWWAVDLGYQRRINVVQVAGDVLSIIRNDFSSFYDYFIAVRKFEGDASGFRYFSSAC